MIELGQDTGFLEELLVSLLAQFNCQVSIGRYFLDSAQPAG
jgi:hypothetical protein